MIIITNSEAETIRAGEALGRELKPGDVVAIIGGLGAGKTAFTVGLAGGLRCAASVSSPTFTIVNEYPGSVPLYHFDLYRLAGEQELFGIGWDDYLGLGGVCAVEWADKAPGALPEGVIKVKIESLGGDSRSIEIQHTTQGDGSLVLQPPSHSVASDAF